MKNINWNIPVSKSVANVKWVAVSRDESPVDDLNRLAGTEEVLSVDAIADGVDALWSLSRDKLADERLRLKIACFEFDEDSEACWWLLKRGNREYDADMLADELIGGGGGGDDNDVSDGVAASTRCVCGSLPPLTRPLLLLLLIVVDVVAATLLFVDDEQRLAFDFDDDFDWVADDDGGGYVWLSLERECERVGSIFVSSWGCSFDNNDDDGECFGSIGLRIGWYREAMAHSALLFAARLTLSRLFASSSIVVDVDIDVSSDELAIFLFVFSDCSSSREFNLSLSISISLTSTI